MVTQASRAVLTAATTAAWFTAAAVATYDHDHGYDNPYHCPHPVAAYSKAIDGDHAYCFQKHPLSLPQWGWTHKICPGSTQKHVLWADAYGCDTSYGYPVGYAEVVYDNYGKLYVKAEGKGWCDLSKLYVYVGSDYAPKHKGAYGVSPHTFEYAYSEHKLYEIEVPTQKYGPYADCVYVVLYAEACCEAKRPIAPPAPYVTDCYGTEPCAPGQCRVPGSCECSYKVKCKVNPCSQYTCNDGYKCVPNACDKCRAFCVEAGTPPYPPAARPLAPYAPAPCGPYSPPCDRGECRVPGSCGCDYRRKCKVNPCSLYTCKYGYKCLPNACGSCRAFCVPDLHRPVY